VTAFFGSSERRRQKGFLFYFSDSIFPTEIMLMTTQVSLNPLEQEDFARLDYQVMRQAFESQNELKLSEKWGQSAQWGS
jgi:hypothetical protein